MKLIQKLELRESNGGKRQTWALFECPICGQRVEMTKFQGLRQHTCSVKCGHVAAAESRVQTNKLAAEVKTEPIKKQKPHAKPWYACDKCNRYLQYKGQPCRSCLDGKAVQVSPVPEVNANRIGVNNRKIRFNREGRL